MTKLGYKIRRLFIQNVKRIKIVEIIPKGNVVEIAGENAQGKSSTLDAIIYTLGGKEEIPIKPIRDGEKSAKVLIETDEFTVIRTWTDNDRTYLTVAANTGKSPQAFLNEKISRISFYPVSFLAMKPKEQEALLRKVSHLDTKDLEEERARLYELRKTVGYEVKRLEVFRKELGEPVYGLPDEEVSSQDLIGRINTISEQTDARNRLISKIASIHGDLKTVEERIGIKKEQIRVLQEEVAAMETAQGINTKRAEAIQKGIDELKDIEDPVPLRGDLKILEEKNALIRKNQQIAKVQNQWDDKRVEYETYTGEIHDTDTAIQERILNTKFPVEGLSVTEEGITFNNIPLSQVSQAEAIKIGLAIAEELNPELQIILIKDGSLLDKKSMKIINDYAVEKDCQIWIERVEPTSADSIIIEDGGVVKQ